MKPRILVVDDKKDFAKGVAMVLSEFADDVVVAFDAEEALDVMNGLPADLVVSDIRMPGMDGLTLLETIDERWPRTRVILLTAFGTVPSAVRAMKHNAFDYLTKPIDNDELLAVVEKAWAEMCERDEVCRFRTMLADGESFHGIWTRDARMTPVVETIRRAARTNATVLVSGESGTGKELVARALHEESPRRDQSFVAFNAGALTESLAEVELFGCEKGAYTGADRSRPGLFAEADGGTLFIDELPSMPASLQSKLLRVVQEREVLRVGSSVPVHIDVRIVAATNVPPSQLLHEGLVRKDLYYRLAVIKISVPPLRERKDDIPLLANLFLKRYEELMGLERPLGLTPTALRILVAHDWPGNVRELQNVVERAAVMALGDKIGPEGIELDDDDLDWSSASPENLAYDEAKRQVLERFQRRYVERLLAQSDGNLSAAARSAGITRAALYRLTKRLDIDIRERRSRPPG